MIEKTEFESGAFYLGDCFEVMEGLKAGSVDMVLADLPYGTTACKWDSVLPFDELWKSYWNLANSSCSVVLTASQPFTSALVMSQAKNFKHEWIWEKNIGSNFAQTKVAPMKEHESILVFNKGKIVYNPIKEDRSDGSKHNIGKKLNSSSSKEHHSGLTNKNFERKALDEQRFPRSIQKFYFNRRQHSLHPTQKPVALFEYLIRTYTNEGMMVLDNTAGSGTTAIAAMNAGRRWICIEKDETYYRAAVERVRKHEEILKEAA